MNGDSGVVLRKGLRLVAAISGVAAGLLGAVGVGAALAGDRYLTDATLVATAAVLTSVVLFGAVVTWWRPITAAIAMLVGIAGYGLVIAGSWANVWSAYQTAVQTSGAAENQFWSSGVLAVASLAVALPFLAIGVLIAIFGHDWSRAATPRAVATT